MLVLAHIDHSLYLSGGHLHHDDGPGLELLALGELVAEGALCHILDVDVDGNLDVGAVNRLYAPGLGVLDPVVVLGLADGLDSGLAAEDGVAAALDSHRLRFVVLDMAEGAEGQFVVGILPPVEFLHDESAAAAPLVEDGECLGAFHLLEGQEFLAEVDILLAGLAPGDQHPLVFRGFPVAVKPGEGVGKGLHVGVEQGVGSLGAVHAQPVLRNREGQIAAVGGDDAASGAGDLALLGGPRYHLAAVGPVDELQVYHTDDRHDSHRDEQHIDESHF